MAIFGYFLSVLPAYAGVILELATKALDLTSTSRVCGGDPIPLPLRLSCTLYFPRMRG